MNPSKLTKTLSWLKTEIMSALPAIIYFAIAFNIVYFTEGLMLRPDDIRYTSLWSANIGAIIMGKILIIANVFPFINAFPQKPLIYNITWKFIIYSLFTFALQLIDIFCERLIHHKSFALAYQHIKFALTSRQFWGVQMLIISLLFIFVLFSELIHAIGRNKVEKILFG